MKRVLVPVAALSVGVVGVAAAVKAECGPGGCKLPELAPVANPAAPSASGATSKVDNANTGNINGTQSFGLSGGIFNSNYINGDSPKVGVTKDGCSLPVNQTHVGVNLAGGLTGMEGMNTKTFGVGLNVNHSRYHTGAFRGLCEKFHGLVVEGQKNAVELTVINGCLSIDGAQLAALPADSPLRLRVETLCGTGLPAKQVLAAPQPVQTPVQRIPATVVPPTEPIPAEPKRGG